MYVREGDFGHEEEANERGFRKWESRIIITGYFGNKHNEIKKRAPDCRKESRKRAARRNWSAVE